MATTSTSTKSYGISVGTSQTTEGEDGPVTVTNTDTVGIANSITLGDSDAGSGLSMELGGEATALGEDTYASGSVTGVIDGNGGTTTANGTVTFTAAALDVDGAYTDAFSYAAVSGADIVLSSTSTSTTTVTTSGATYAAATSSTDITAIDLTHVDFSDPIAVETGGAGPTIGGDVNMVMETASTPLPDGNLALLDVNGFVFDENTFLTVDAYALTVEDALSLSGAIMLAEVG